MTRLLVTGAGGQLGAYLLRQPPADGDILAWMGSQSVDLTSADAVATAFRAARPDVVLHAAALARLGDCQRDPDRAHRVNTLGTALLVQLAAAVRARLVYISTDLVFDGMKGGYRESDVPAPLSVYGRTKRDAERAVLDLPGNAVVRVGLLFGPSRNGRRSFFDEQMAALRGGPSITLFADEWRTPLDLATAARALWAIALSDFTGVLHVGGPERLSRWEMGQQLAAYLGGDASRLVAARRDDVSAPEPRPRDTSLDSSQWRRLFPALRWPSFASALAEML